MKKITAQHYAELLEHWSDQASFSELRSRIALLAKWIVARGQRHRLSAIEKAWEQLELKKGSVVSVEIATAYALNPKDRATLVEQLEHHLEKKIILTEKVKPKLIGGAQLRVLDRQWDGSVKEQLHQLHLRLMR